MNKLNHVAFIMDGNGRWGKKKYKGRNFGHLRGVETVKKIVKNSIKLKIPIVTFYVFSSENWKRPKKEISFLFNLIKSYFTKEIENLDLFADMLSTITMVEWPQIIEEPPKNLIELTFKYEDDHKKRSVQIKGLDLKFF